jgi:hypothetical protein
MMEPREAAAYLIEKEPFYVGSGDEIALFTAAWQAKLPVMLKGPHRLRQDPVRPAHGLAPETSADHRGLP